jgi:hypothetical protein
LEHALCEEIDGGGNTSDSSISALDEIFDEEREDWAQQTRSTHEDGVRNNEEPDNRVDAQKKVISQFG